MYGLIFRYSRYPTVEDFNQRYLIVIFFLCMYTCLWCWDSLFKLDIFFTCAGTPLDSHTEMVLILYLLAPHCKEGFVYIWFPKDFQELCEIALVAFGVSGNLTPFESEFK